MLKRNARLFKNSPALVSDDETITFGELLRKVQSLSGGLSEIGIHKGDRIAILAVLWSN
jgi:non-ribosomal peptide synthetase component E (peptide arylation enzyme)